jgi:hypothetical protein
MDELPPLLGDLVGVGRDDRIEATAEELPVWLRVLVRSLDQIPLATIALPPPEHREHHVDMPDPRPFSSKGICTALELPAGEHITEGLDRQRPSALERVGCMWSR